MSLRTKEQLAKIKPLSRFVEHFDLMPPTELLDEPSIEDSSIETKSKKKDKAQKKMTPLYALAPSFNKRPSKLSIKLAEQIPSNTTYSPVSPISPISPTNYTMELPLPGTVGRTQSNLSASSHQETLISDQEINVVDSIILNTSNSTNLPKITSSPSPSHSTSRNNFQTASRLDLNSFKQGTLLPKSQQPTSPRPSGGRVKYTRTSLNRGEVIIKRHESWDRFLSLISTWIADIVRLSIKSQKSSGNFMKASKSEMVSKQQGNTADLASLEEKKNFSQRLKVQLPILEKFRKECHAYIKTLKNRPDLNLEEFLKRAEITANLMAQLKTACEEARRTIEKGAQLTNDPWLVNLYVLRQLKKEVDEENRLRLLMIPIQRAMHDFETRVMKSVEQAFTVCFERPDLIQEDKLANLQASLNEAVSNNWDTFVANHSKNLVMESSPRKHYLKINYTCKNDPLVMTLHKGELERRSGVLNKHTQRFFVLTESGFMHQFKLNDKVSPEYSIYVPGSTIIPGLDISHLNLSGLDEQGRSKPSDRYSFEIQRPGSVLQRDKSFIFRTFRLEEMVIWSRLLSDVATRPLDAILQPENTMLMTRPLPPFSSHNSAGNSISPASPELSVPSLKQQVQIQDQATTPPLSPIEKIVMSSTTNTGVSPPVNDNDLHPPALPVMARIIPPPQSPSDLNESNTLKPKLYSPQLNI